MTDILALTLTKSPPKKKDRNEPRSSDNNEPIALSSAGK